MSILALAGSPAFAASVWDDFPAPPESRVQIVSDYMMRNNLPQSIRKFTSSRSVDDVVAFYMKQWEATGISKPLLSQVDGQKVVSRGSKENFMTVQVSPDSKGGSSGYMSVIYLSKFNGDGPKPGEGITMPDSTVVMTDNRSDDGPKSSRLVVLQNGHSVDFNMRFFRSSFRFGGWMEAGNLTLKDRSSASMTFRRGVDEVNVVITNKAAESGVTGVMLNYVTPK